MVNAQIDEVNGLSSTGQPLSVNGTAVLSPREQDEMAFSTHTGTSVADLPHLTPKKGDALVDRIVLTDGYHWVYRDPNDPKNVLAQVLRTRGDVVAVTQAEARRGEMGGFLGSEDDLRRIVFGVEAVTEALPDEDALLRYSPVELLAYLANHTDDLDRVEAIENAREGGASKDVLKAIQTVRKYAEG